MRISYSKDADILHISFTPPAGKVATVENENGDLLRIDTATGKIIGVAVQLFMYRIGNGEKIDIPEVGFSSSSLMDAIAVANIHVKTH